MTPTAGMTTDKQRLSTAANTTRADPFPPAKEDVATSNRVSSWRGGRLRCTHKGRGGHGPRLPLLVISPWAKPNYVSHTVTDQTSILRFIEDTFLNQQRIGQGSYDAIAGSIADMLDFDTGAPQTARWFFLIP